MLFSPNQSKVLAFAGLAQSGKLVSQLAAEPEHDEAALRSSAISILVTNPKDIKEVFKGSKGVALGLKSMKTLLKGQGMQSSTAQEMIRYLMSIDQLAQRLNQAQSTQTIIEKGLQELNLSFNTLLAEASPEDQQAEFDELYRSIGTLYQKSLSQLTPQIIVRGAQGRLQDIQSVSRVRTALFAGVRAAYLWHQQGGRRWHLMFARRAYADLAAELMPGEFK